MCIGIFPLGQFSNKHTHILKTHTGTNKEEISEKKRNSLRERAIVISLEDMCGNSKLKTKMASILFGA